MPPFHQFELRYCENGHGVTSFDQTAFAGKYCESCGSRFLDLCSNCGELVSGVWSCPVTTVGKPLRQTPSPPNHCRACGYRMPWAIANPPTESQNNESRLTIRGESKENRVPFQANVIKVFIASPGDVLEERATVRDVVNEWNALHSDTTKTVLLTKSWETHASPMTGHHPQSIINDEVLHDADLVVAIFGSRVGTPTETEVSGTVEELKRHVAKEKPAMIYFSSAPVRRSEIDMSQLELLDVFKSWCRERSLYWEYDNIGRFKELFRNHLVLRVQRQYLNHQQAHAVTNDRSSLSSPAIQLLVDAASQNMYIIRSSSRGFVFSVGENRYGNPRDMTDAGKWQGAFAELIDHGCIYDLNGNGITFGLTSKGSGLASDSLKFNGAGDNS
jgi:hypothetical protein